MLYTLLEYNTNAGHIVGVRASKGVGWGWGLCADQSNWENHFFMGLPSCTEALSWWKTGKAHTQAVATKLESHFFGLFIVQQPSESCYYGNQPGPCPAEVLVTFNRRKTHNERWGMFFILILLRWKREMRKRESLVCHIHATVAIHERTGLTRRWGKLMKVHSYISALCSDSLLHCVFPSISGDDNTLVSEQVQSRCMTPNDVSPSHQNCCRMSNDMNSQYRRQWFLKVGEARVPLSNALLCKFSGRQVRLWLGHRTHRKSSAWSTLGNA